LISTSKIEIVASFPPDGCDDTGGKAFPQMRLSALFYLGRSFYLGRLTLQKI
jgi:hypothetical protein